MSADQHREPDPMHPARQHTQPGTLPLRPLTTGELLDAAVVLLRTRAAGLLGLGAALALAEQVILFPLRRWADVDSSFLPGDNRLGEFGFLVLAGIATEVFCITVLGGVASTGAARALLGSAAPARSRRRIAGVVVVALVGAIVTAASAGAFLVFPVPLQVLGMMLAVIATVVLWPFAYGLLGLSAPIVVIDEYGPGRALIRSLRLAFRNGMRATWIRVLGYVAWLIIRLGLGSATVAVVNLFFSSPSATVDNLIMAGTWLVVNALAYPMLGCLDVANHLDARMRTEGLDIALRRTLRRGVASDVALAVPR
jgi:hypothetical protein